MKPTPRPPTANCSGNGQFRRRNRNSTRWIIFKNTAPATPTIAPNNTNQGSCSTLVNSTGGTLYDGLSPKKLRDTTAATTDENTSGANRFIEKLPSTINAANTAPVIGAL